MSQHHYFTNNADLQQKRKEVSFRFSNLDFRFVSDIGVFAKDSIDYGSRLLVENILQTTIKTPILDVGCGYGFMGIAVAKIWNTHVDMLDINDRAIELTNLNIEKNNVCATAFQSDLFSKVEKQYALIMCNPPIRAGKKVIYRLFEDAKAFLQDNGELWIVMRKQHGANSAIDFLQARYSHVEKVDKSNGFWIIKAVK